MQTNLVKNLTEAQVNGLKSSIHALEVQTTILKTLLKGGDTDEDDNKTEASCDTDGDEDMPATRKTTKRTTSSFDDEEEETPPAKTTSKKKTKAPTVEDVNAACKAAAKRTDRETVTKVLKKQFQVKSVTELDEDQYQDVIEAMTEVGADE